MIEEGWCCSSLKSMSFINSQILYIYLVSSASMFELRFGFQSYIVPPQQFCSGLVAGDTCPINPGQNFTIERVLPVSTHSWFFYIIIIPVLFLGL